MSESRIPSKEECLDLLKIYNTPANVIKHCLLVTEISEEFCNKIDTIDRDLVIAGAMLHDIGRSVDHSLKHAVEGVKILEKEKLDPKLISIVRNHIGAGIPKDEAVKLGLPAEDFIPSTREEIIVSYVDKLVCGSRRCSFEEALDQFIRKFGKDSNVVTRFLKHKEIIEKMFKSV